MLYKIDDISNWIRRQIKREQTTAYLSIAVIAIGILAGVSIGYLYFDVSISDILCKIGLLGISLPALIGAAYFLYQLDQAEIRKSEFLSHVIKERKKIKNRALKNGESFNDTYIAQSAIEAIILDILKSKLSEKEIKSNSDV